jgi:hypothetical protein
VDFAQPPPELLAAEDALLNLLARGHDRSG